MESHISFQLSQGCCTFIAHLQWRTHQLSISTNHFRAVTPPTKPQPSGGTKSVPNKQQLPSPPSLVPHLQLHCICFGFSHLLCGFQPQNLPERRRVLANSESSQIGNGYYYCRTVTMASSAWEWLGLMQMHCISPLATPALPNLLFQEHFEPF